MLVGARGQGTPIPEEIEAVRTLLREELPFTFQPFSKIGQRIRIRSGALAGLEGVLVSRNSERALVISVNAIQRSLSVSIQGYDVEAV